MAMPLLPEEPYSDIEKELIDNEPPGLFPQNNDSYWGQQRKVFGGALQLQIADFLSLQWTNLVIDNADEATLSRWEEQLDVPILANRTMMLRRTILKMLLGKGVWTRKFRLELVSLFISETQGAALQLIPGGIELTATGVPFLPEPGLGLVEGVEIGAGIILSAGGTQLTGALNIIETITGFSADIRIRTDLEPDVDALARVLDWLTPAHLSYTITITDGP